MIIRGEKVSEQATLTPGRLLEWESATISSPSWFEEERLQAFEKGKRLGEEKGYAQAVQEMHSSMRLLQTLANKLLDHKEKLLDQLKPEVIQFSLAVCERAIRKELSQPEVFVKWLNTLLSYVINRGDEEKISLFLAPGDLRLVEKFMESKSYLSLREDPLMRHGDCRIETPTKMVRWSIERELEDLESKVLCL